MNEKIGSLAAILGSVSFGYWQGTFWAGIWFICVICIIGIFIEKVNYLRNQ